MHVSENILSGLILSQTPLFLWHKYMKVKWIKTNKDFFTNTMQQINFLNLYV